MILFNPLTITFVLWWYFKNQIDLRSWQFKGGGAKAWFLTPKI